MPQACPSHMQAATAMAAAKSEPPSVKLETMMPQLPVADPKVDATQPPPLGKTHDKSRSAQVNHFISNTPFAPPHIQKRLQEIDDMPARSGKRQCKGQMISEFCKHDDWNTPYFKQFARSEEINGAHKEKPWVSWDEFKKNKRCNS